MFAHSYSSRQSRVCWWNSVRSAKQYSLQMMTEGHSGELLVSEIRSPTGRVLQVDGPAAAKLRGPKLTVLVAGTTRSRRMVLLKVPGQTYLYAPVLIWSIIYWRSAIDRNYLLQFLRLFYRMIKTEYFGTKSNFVTPSEAVWKQGTFAKSFS